MWEVILSYLAPMKGESGGVGTTPHIAGNFDACPLTQTVSVHPHIDAKAPSAQKDDQIDIGAKIRDNDFKK